MALPTMRSDRAPFPISALLLLATLPAAARAQEAPAALAASAAEALRTDTEREAFLQEADVVGARPAGGGGTSTTRATLKKGGLTHDAHIQTINEEKGQQKLSSGLDLDFRDTYRNNVAAYRLDRML